MGSMAFPASSLGSAGPSLFSVCLSSCLWAGGLEVHEATHGSPCALRNEALTLRQQWGCRSLAGWLCPSPPPLWHSIPAQSADFSSKTLLSLFLHYRATHSRPLLCLRDLWDSPPAWVHAGLPLCMGWGEQRGSWFRASLRRAGPAVKSGTGAGGGTASALFWCQAGLGTWRAGPRPGGGRCLLMEPECGRGGV